MADTDSVPKFRPDTVKRELPEAGELKLDCEMTGLSNVTMANPVPTTTLTVTTAAVLVEESCLT